MPYSEYPRFHKLMAEMSGMVFDAALIDVVLRSTVLPDRLRSGAGVADFGCGSGRAVKLMAPGVRRLTDSPASTFSDEAVAAGPRRAAQLGLANATFKAP